MLTPSFQITQETNFLKITIKAPYTKISDTEIFIEECDFKFYSKPYYLRLTLPGPIVEDGRETAKYDADTGSFTVRVAKLHAGEHFDGLDLLTRLLAPSGQTSLSTGLISPLGENECTEGKADGSEDEDNGAEPEFDWQVEQQPYIEADEVVSIERVRYGFANQKSGVLHRLQSELTDVIDLKDADNVSESQRRVLRLADEDDKFDDDHYLADLYDDAIIDHALEFRPPWDMAYRKLKNGTARENLVVFTDDEQEAMKQLKRQQYLLDEASTRAALLSLVDIIYAYAYSLRTTDGEHTVESSWTICKLSGTLSWLATYSGVRDVAVASYRRSLVYPLYRHWSLSARVFRDVRRIFSVGRRYLLRCLLDIHQLIRVSSDSHYLLDDLYITDYCVWIQSVSSKQLESLANSLMQLKVTKADVGFDLELLEEAARIAVEESGQEVTTDHHSQEAITDHHSQEVTTDQCSQEVTTDQFSQEVTTDHCSQEVATDHPSQEVTTDLSGQEATTDHVVVDRFSSMTLREQPASDIVKPTTATSDDHSDNKDEETKQNDTSETDSECPDSSCSSSGDTDTDDGSDTDTEDGSDTDTEDGSDTDTDRGDGGIGDNKSDTDDHRPHSDAPTSASQRSDGETLNF